MTGRHYDFVIVGGGSAGSALANRLSADPGTTVLVLEAGHMDFSWDPLIHMPAALSMPIGNRWYDWCYSSEPEPHMQGRRIAHPRGKVLGGSSSINGMIFQPGNPLDYDRWAGDPGMQGWDYAHCLPYFKRMETCLAGADTWRGGSGPLVLERGPATNPLFEAFFAAAGEAGYPRTDDVNGYRQEGFAKFDRNIHRGRRLSAARAYLHPVMHRRNLAVRTLAQVTSVRFEGRRAAGVEFVLAGRGCHSDRAGEVILCGGAINTPQILQLSGVGSARLLESLGVAVVADLPGRRQPAGSSRGVRPVRKPPARVRRSRNLVAEEARRRRAVVAATQGARGDEPLRSWRLLPQQRRSRLSEPDVSLPADGGPVRRLEARCRLRLPGTRGTDVLRCARLRQYPVEGFDAPSGIAVQLPVYGPGPPRMGGGDPHRAPDTESARDGTLQRGGDFAGCGRHDRCRDTRLGAPRCRDRAASVLHREDGSEQGCGARSCLDARAWARRDTRRRRERFSLHPERKHVCAGHDGGRKERGPDPRQHTGVAGGRAVLSLAGRQPDVSAGRSAAQPAGSPS